MSKLYKLGVIGDPIEHSLSPFIHSRFSRNENINIEYLPYKVSDSDFIRFIDEFFSDKLLKD
jgi:shikimate dehydrogenase